MERKRAIRIPLSKKTRTRREGFEVVKCSELLGIAQIQSVGPFESLIPIWDEFGLLDPIRNTFAHLATEEW